MNKNISTNDYTNDMVNPRRYGELAELNDMESPYLHIYTNDY